MVEALYAWAPPHERKGGRGRRHTREQEDVCTPWICNFGVFPMAFDYSLWRLDSAYKTCAPRIFFNVAHACSCTSYACKSLD